MANNKNWKPKKNVTLSKRAKRDVRYVRRGVGRELKSIGKGAVNGLLDIFLFRR